MISAAVGALICPRALVAQGTAPPTVVPQDRDDRDLMKDLQGVPDNVKTLIVNFDKQRDQYLQQQHLLMVKLRSATTKAERDAIRDQLQANRKEFLADLKAFRQELRSDLLALKGKISHAEFRRIIDAAHDAVNEGGHHHRGH